MIVLEPVFDEPAVVDPVVNEVEWDLEPAQESAQPPPLRFATAPRVARAPGITPPGMHHPRRMCAIAATFALAIAAAPAVADPGNGQQSSAAPYGQCASAGGGPSPCAPSDGGSGHKVGK